MLLQLLIRNIVLIDRLEIRFPAGLSVLTGETGAGKSILLDAFALALGGRGDGALVRHGETQGHITAVFDAPPDHQARALAAAADLDLDGDLILRRIQFADGRTRALVNDQPVSVQTLREIGGSLVEIHGQHADRALVDPTGHRAILDAYAGLGATGHNVAAAHRRWRDGKGRVSAQEARLATMSREAEYLRHAVEELTELTPVVGEEANLADKRQLMMQSEKVSGDLTDALESVSASIPALAATGRKLERRAATAPALAQRPIEALDGVLIALEEARMVLDEAIRAAEFDPHELERTEERLFKLRGASRKYNVVSDALPELRDRLQAESDAIDTGEAELSALRAALVAAEDEYVVAAGALSAERTRVSGALDQAVARELDPLKLGRARFLTRIETDRTCREPAGFDRVEFWVETNPGTRPGPLMKVASGGELSRFVLALKVVLADRGSAPTLVFDEIDTGVGGAVSDAIGQRLARLAERVQVMAVTHAPQVAARASSHFLIAKEAGPEGDRVRTQVVPLEPAARREEIARMLAGASITDEARAAAGRLLEAAGP